LRRANSGRAPLQNESRHLTYFQQSYPVESGPCSRIRGKFFPPRSPPAEGPLEWAIEGATNGLPVAWRWALPRTFIKCACVSNNPKSGGAASNLTLAIVGLPLTPTCHIVYKRAFEMRGRALGHFGRPSTHRRRRQGGFVGDLIIFFPLRRRRLRRDEAGWVFHKSRTISETGEGETNG